MASRDAQGRMSLCRTAAGEVASQPQRQRRAHHCCPDDSTVHIAAVRQPAATRPRLRPGGWQRKFPQPEGPCKREPDEASPSEGVVEPRISQKVAVGVVFVAAMFMSIMDGNV